MPAGCDSNCTASQHPSIQCVVDAPPPSALHALCNHGLHILCNHAHACDGHGGRRRPLSTCVHSALDCHHNNLFAIANTAHTNSWHTPAVLSGGRETACPHMRVSRANRQGRREGALLTLLELSGCHVLHESTLNSVEWRVPWIGGGCGNAGVGASSVGGVALRCSVLLGCMDGASRVLLCCCGGGGVQSRTRHGRCSRLMGHDISRGTLGAHARGTPLGEGHLHPPLLGALRANCAPCGGACAATLGWPAALTTCWEPGPANPHGLAWQLMVQWPCTRPSLD
jgi:hypothetical protein